MVPMGRTRMKPVFVYTITVLFGLVIVTTPIPAVYATELNSGDYTLNQVVQLALQHNPMMSGAEAVLEQRPGPTGHGWRR